MKIIFFISTLVMFSVGSIAVRPDHRSAPTSAEVRAAARILGGEPATYETMDRAELAAATIQAEFERLVGTAYGTGPDELVCNTALARACQNAGYPFHLAVSHELYKSWTEGGTPGAAVFFSHNGGARIHHVGLRSQGDGCKMIHASSSRGVRVDQYCTGYWAVRFSGYRLIPSVPRGDL